MDRNLWFFFFFEKVERVLLRYIVTVPETLAGYSILYKSRTWRKLLFKNTPFQSQNLEWLRSRPSFHLKYLPSKQWREFGGYIVCFFIFSDIMAWLSSIPAVLIDLHLSWVFIPDHRLCSLLTPTSSSPEDVSCQL